jgi:GAF domain-containing protein
MPAHARPEVLVALARFVVSDASLAETLAHVATITTDAVPGARFAGMTLLDERGTPTTAVFTASESPEIDAAQYVSGDGPCLDAWRQAHSIRVDDIAEPSATYEQFRLACLDHGIRSTLSVPLMAKGEALGALNLYAAVAHGFSDADEQLTTELASLAGVLLANSLAYWGAYELSQQLGAALSSRPIIDQAKGILMARTPGLDAEGAFDLLKKASQRENVKVRDIAARIVDHPTG